MGSLSYYTELPTRAALREYMDKTFDPDRAKIIDLSIQSTGYGRIGGWSTVGYAAVRHTEGDVFAAVWLANKENGEFCVKVMDETVGPGLYGPIPKRILNALTPTEHEGAQEWRAEAWRAREVAAKDAKDAKAAIGQTIEFDATIHYGEPVGEISRVHVIDRKLFTDPATGHRLRAPRNWAALPYKIVN